jgi:uroporphyrinogen decarboxylase
MPKETMTPRERWLAVLTRQKPDRVPMDYWSTLEATAKLLRHLGLSSDSEEALVAAFKGGGQRARLGQRPIDVLRREMLDRLHVDYIIGAGPRYVGPRLKPHTDVFGCRYRDIEYGTGAYGECVFNPLAQYNSVEEIERNYTWPVPDWWDYSEIPAQVKGWEHTHPIRGGGSEPFLVYKNLRGQEQAFVDLVEHPEIVHTCLDKLFGLAYANTERIYAQIPGKVMITYVAEDMGSQDGLMLSVRHIREFLLPRMKRIIDLAHSAGAYVFHHNDGAARKILPDMIALGIDVLNPIQWRCKGMEREGLKADFGAKLIFHGAVDNQYTLPFGTVAEVRQEVLDNLRILGAGGGYILAPCHNIQAVSPPENIVAMYETCYENGWA